MADPVAAWHAEHKRFEKLLDFLDREMAAFAREGDPDYALMADVVQYLQAYADAFHHPREDAAFAKLVERDPSLEVAVNRLRQQHRVIAAAGDKLAGYLEAILNDAIVERKAVEAAAETYLVYYRHHLAAEEREMLPSAAQLLGPDDWVVVGRAAAPVHDPLFGENPAAQYRALRARIDVEARRGA